MTSTSLARRAPRVSRLAAGLALVAATLVGGCGGGTSRVDQFVPERVLAFGDEMSTLVEGGYKYTVNTVDDNDVLKCMENPIWVQWVALNYGMVFSQCNPDATATPKAKMLAFAGATSDGLATQIRNFTSTDSVRSDDLATVLVGMNDVLQAYASYPTESEEDLVRQVEAAGERVAGHVNDLAGAGARVLVSSIPDMGKTPFARKEDLEHGEARSRLLTHLSEAFNVKMRLALINDGSKIGLLMLDDLMRGMVRSPGIYSFSNIDRAVCAENAPLPNCSNHTLIPSDTSPTPSPTAYMWADDTRPGITVQRYLGQQALSRARNNPF